MITAQRRWLTRIELAEYLNCSVVTIWRHSKSGRLPQPCKLGPGFARYDVLEIDAAMLQGQ